MSSADLRVKIGEMVNALPDEGLIEVFSYLLECEAFWEIKKRVPPLPNQPPVLSMGKVVASGERQPLVITEDNPNG